MLVTLAPAAHGGVGDDDVILNNKTSQVVDNMSVDNETQHLLPTPTTITMLTLP